MKGCIKLDKQLYPVVFIQKAILDYKQIAMIQVASQGEKHTICEVNCPEKDLEEVKKEFSNYLIALISTAMI